MITVLLCLFARYIYLYVCGYFCMVHQSTNQPANHFHIRGHPLTSNILCNCYYVGVLSTNAHCMLCIQKMLQTCWMVILYLIWLLGHSNIPDCQEEITTGTTYGVNNVHTYKAITFFMSYFLVRSFSFSEWL